MIRTILLIDGMHCPMCESHVNAIVRKSLAEAKVSSSHKKGQVLIDSEKKVDLEDVKTKLAESGYRVLNVSEETIEKSGGFFKRLFGSR